MHGRFLFGFLAILAIVALACSPGCVSNDPSTAAPASGQLERQAEPGAFTRQFVARALERYESEGRDDTIAYYNTPASVDGEWYVFIIGEDGRNVAHPTVPQNVGRDLNDAEFVDYNDGTHYGREILAAQTGGNWLDYTYLNPATGKEERKRTWVVRRDGLIFGSGWYEVEDVTQPADRDSNPGLFTKQAVDQAIERYESEGRDDTIAYYNTPASVDGEWYVFIVGEDGRGIAHPTIPANVGEDLGDPKFTDVNGTKYGEEILAANEQGVWVSYIYFNPARDNREENKLTWAVKRDGLIFGSGWYQIVTN